MSAISADDFIYSRNNWAGQKRKYVKLYVKEKFRIGGNQISQCYKVSSKFVILAQNVA